MSILTPLLLGCVLALFSGVTASLLLILALNGVMALSRRFQASAPTGDVVMPVDRPVESAITLAH